MSRIDPAAVREGLTALLDLATSGQPISGVEYNRTLAPLLELVDRTQPYGTELFNALCRLTITVAVEAVSLRRQGNVLEVLLAKRAPTESAYPNEWHSPGSALRPDESFDDVFSRLAVREHLGKITGRKFVDVYNNPQEDRGHFLHLVNVCSVPNTAQGQWFDVKALPEPMVPFHRDHVIPMAVEAFLAQPVPSSL